MFEPSFSRRVFIKWEHEEKFNEPTSTWVLTAPNGDFVDTRINLKDESKSWFITGSEKAIKIKKGYESSIEFVHVLDNFTKWDLPPGKDVGNFKQITSDDWDVSLKKLFNYDDAKTFNLAHYRLEEGCMENADCNNVIQDYKEIWDSLDPINSTPDSLISLVKNSKEKFKCQVYKILEETNGRELGRFIQVGKFGAGVAVNSKKEYQVIRIYENNVIYHFGKDYEDIFACFLNNSLPKSSWKLCLDC
ncbi:hypothetical protein HANVADRAFT_53596 [Hanseniaspora valbyensis NRRL Y-1626]|uniref:Protein HRI1 n=1 Tax=Hanseniaspora valbyensis NRRL Y-1626 TaxID=766949 RepID=A0A1B7TAX9_9ASCO|nr:hypothetical protein HANVADRAFT_53596 [Hanseniaspora valbyensis NRRL Y-1626]